MGYEYIPSVRKKKKKEKCWKSKPLPHPIEQKKNNFGSSGGLQDLHDPYIFIFISFYFTYFRFIIFCKKKKE